MRYTARVRGVRQHVNPLGLHYQRARATKVVRPTHLPPHAPVEVELGCADAKFSFDFARARPESFVVGLEIREALVERNAEWARRAGLDNLRFAYVNMNVDLDRVFAPRSVDRFHLLFPDPWFKARHQKRRVIEPGLLQTLASQLREGGEVHYASDVFELTLGAMAEFEGELARDLGFRNTKAEWSFARNNPVPFESRREVTTRGRGQRVWRVRYRLEI
jgi:tRNA (guanine-N7-)-methyltransferase